MASSERWTAATFNANSIRVRLEQILAWLADNEVDVLAIQETKVADDEFPADAIRDAGYHVVYRGEGGQAGVALLSRSEPSNVGFGIDGRDEDRVLCCCVDNVPVVNTYVPQGQQTDASEFQHKLRFFRELRELFEREYAPDEPLLWMGDLNVAPEPIDIYDPKRLIRHVDFAPEVRDALDHVHKWGLVDLVRRLHAEEPDLYSYWDYRAKNPIEEKKGWRVDHILVTTPLAERCVNAWIDVEARKAERPSDHTFVVAEFEF